MKDVLIFKSYCFILLLLFLFSFHSQGQEVLLHKTHAQRLPYLASNFYDNPIHTDSIRFFSKVNKLKSLAQAQKDRELYLETIYLKLNFLSSRNYKNYLQEAHELLKIADAEKLLYLQIRIRQAIGFHYFYERKNYGEALYWFLNSDEFLSQISETDFPEKQEALSNIANICYTMQYPSKALKYLKLAEKHSYKHANNLDLNILNTEGLAYMKLKKDKKAELVFLKLIEKASQSKVDIWKLIAATNLAELYINKNLYRKAIKVLKVDFVVDPAIYRSEILKRKVILAESYLGIKEFNNFNKLIEEIHKEDKNINDLTLNKRIIYLYFKYFELLKDYQQAIRFADSSMCIQNQINYNEQQSNIQLAVDRDAYRQLLQKEKDIEASKIKSKQQVFFVSLIGVLILLLVFILFRKEVKKQQISIQKKDTQISQKDKELETAKTYLKNFTEEISRKDKLITEIVHKASNSENTLSTRSIFTDVDWIEFKQEFSTVYPLFFDQLKNLNPSITPALERIAALICLGLENIQMASLLGISVDSVTRSKRRLKEKLPEGKDKLESYLKELTVYSNKPTSLNLEKDM